MSSTRAEELHRPSDFVCKRRLHHEAAQPVLLKPSLLL